MDIRERMKNGKLYFCTDESVAREQLQCLDKLYDFNQTRPSEMEKRQKLLKELLAEVGENCYVEPPLHANWAKNTHFGSNVYANFNLTLVDDTDIYVGDSVMFGPNVTLATAGHPIDPDLRRKVAQFNLPVRHRQQRLDRRGGGRPARSDHRRRQRDRRGQHRDERHPGRGRRGRQPVPGPAADQRP